VREQHSVGGVSDAHPDDLDVRYTAHMHLGEVFVFRDDNGGVPLGMSHYGGVRVVAKLNISDMNCIMTAPAQPMGKRRRQLVIDKKLHSAAIAG
jgi:hypothetical protein